MSPRSPITIEKISVAGFRAYLDEQNISLADGKKPMSLAVFAPNAKGKSSLVDAIEFFFSETGTLERLGQNKSPMQAGREALAHVRADAKNIDPSVSIEFRSAKGSFGGKRTVFDASQTQPEAAREVASLAKVDFIIRGSQLRYFVESQSPSERYSEISDWFGLSALVGAQTNLRNLRIALNQEYEADHATKERLRDLARTTGNAVLTWSNEAVLRWINENHIHPLDPRMSIGGLEKDHPSYAAIKARKHEEDQLAGLAQLNLMLDAFKRLHSKPRRNENGTGALTELKAAYTRLQTAIKNEETEKAKAANNLFKDLWENALKILEDQTVSLDNCPVCETPFARTARGSRSKVTIHVSTRLNSLKAYRDAVAAASTARKNFQEKTNATKVAISNILMTLGGAGHEYEKDKQEFERTSAKVQALKVGANLPETKDLEEKLIALTKRVETERAKKEAQQGDRTWAKALVVVDDLIAVRENLRKIELKRSELKKLRDCVAEQEAFVTGKVTGYSQTIINKLRDRVNDIFRAVHPEQELAPQVRLELDPEGKRPELRLVFDFAPNRRGVVPSGYLSDAQVHTLALSLRLSAVQMFNSDVPIIVLDDVVTSYDADHRRAIAGLIADQFPAHQFLVVTHDERFFQYLREQAPAEKWLFKRITRLDENFGPKFDDHNVSDELVEKRHKRNKSAANEMRQAEEEWLTRVCRDFGVDVRIREIHHPYNYQRSELAAALARFLGARKLVPPSIPGVANRFLNTLQSGQVENFGSHFQDDPQGFGSVGDEIKRWAEFKMFRGAFVCPSCAGKRFKRPDSLSKPVCRKEGCEAQFAFSAV